MVRLKAVPIDFFKAYEPFSSMIELSADMLSEPEMRNGRGSEV